MSGLPSYNSQALGLKDCTLTPCLCGTKDEAQGFRAYQTKCFYQASHVPRTPHHFLLYMNLYKRRCQIKHQPLTNCQMGQGIVFTSLLR